MDALHLATAIACGAIRFITDNSKDTNDRIIEIAVVTPGDLQGGEIRNATSNLGGSTSGSARRCCHQGASHVTRAAHRMSWPLHLLMRVDALDRPRRGTHVINTRGHVFLEARPGGPLEADIEPFAAPGDEGWLNHNKRPALATCTSWRRDHDG